MRRLIPASANRSAWSPSATRKGFVLKPGAKAFEQFARGEHEVIDLATGYRHVFLDPPAVTVDDDDGGRVAVGTFLRSARALTDEQKLVTDCEPPRPAVECQPAQELSSLVELAQLASR